MTQYQRGARLEYKVRDIFRKAGFFVLRSAGSRTAVDLIAVNDIYTIFIQCKRRAEDTEAAMKKLMDTIPVGHARMLEVWAIVDKKPACLASELWE